MLLVVVPSVQDKLPSGVAAAVVLGLGFGLDKPNPTALGYRTYLATKGVYLPPNPSTIALVLETNIC
jgi:hypothetical protein